MDVRLWGPDAWNTMHAITYSYPKDNPTSEEKRDMREFFEAIADVLPCFECRKHFKSMMRKYPVVEHLSSRRDLTRWLIDRHNDVNRRLGKPTVDYEFVDSKYSDYGNVCPMSAASLSSVTPPQKNQQADEQEASYSAADYASLNLNNLLENLEERRKLKRILNMVETVMVFIALGLFIGLVVLMYKYCE